MHPVAMGGPFPTAFLYWAPGSLPSGPVWQGFRAGEMSGAATMSSSLWALVHATPTASLLAAKDKCTCISTGTQRYWSGPMRLRDKTNEQFCETVTKLGSPFETHFLTLNILLRFRLFNPGQWSKKWRLKTKSIKGSQDGCRPTLPIER